MKTKIKTKKAATKRFKITGSGKIMRRAIGMRHLLQHESSKKKRNKRGTFEISKSDDRKVKRMIPGL